MKKSQLFALSLTVAIAATIASYGQPPVSTAAPSETPVARHGQLAIKEGKVVDQDGRPVQLRGMSFFWSQWMGKYFTADVVTWLKNDWHCNILRVAMGVEGGGYLNHPAEEKRKVIAVVDAAIEQGIYVIIDWHDHHAQDHVRESKAFFAEMAQRYGDKPNVIYELYNEPLKISWSEVIKPYHQAVIDTLRHYDADNIVVCGTPSWSQDVDVAASDPLKGDNLAYALHFYSGTHKQSLRNKAVSALNKGVALMVTEFGTTDASGDGTVDKQETLLWWKLLDDNKISWCNWSVGDKAETSAILKPGASPRGGWPVSQLTESGLFIHEELNTKNTAAE